jgi:hypothetical protein
MKDQHDRIEATLIRVEARQVSTADALSTHLIDSAGLRPLFDILWDEHKEKAK